VEEVLEGLGQETIGDHRTRVEEITVQAIQVAHRIHPAAVIVHAAAEIPVGVHVDRVVGVHVDRVVGVHVVVEINQKQSNLKNKKSCLHLFLASSGAF
jgi:myo-inositol catabolism protein IolC